MLTKTDQLKYGTKNLQHSNIKVDTVNTRIKRAIIVAYVHLQMTKLGPRHIKWKSSYTHKKNLITELILTLINMNN